MSRVVRRHASLKVANDRRYTRPVTKNPEVDQMSQQQLQKIIDMLKAQPIAGKPSIEETRAGFEQMAGMFPVEADVKSEPVNAGGVKSEWVTAPGADPGRAVL